MRAIDAIVADVSPATALNDLLALLLAPPSRLTGQLPIKLPELVHRIATAVAEIRGEQEKLAISRRELATLLGELGHDLQRAAHHIEVILSYQLLGPLSVGDDGVISALGGGEIVDRMRVAMMKAENWREKLTGPGRSSVGDVIGLPRPDLLVATGLVGLYMLLLRPPPSGKRERDLHACELLSQASGALPGSLGRWKPIIGVAREFRDKAKREAAVLWSKVAIEEHLDKRRQMLAQLLREGIRN